MQDAIRQFLAALTDTSMAYISRAYERIAQDDNQSDLTYNAAPILTGKGAQDETSGDRVARKQR